MIGTQAVSIITRNSKMKELLKLAAKAASSDSPILLVGETGVGKEIFADFIHRSSPRTQNSMVKIGLSAMPPDLMASELFGHEKGAYTSAVNSKPGLFEMASMGTVFLDDIDDVPCEIQGKLLRVLESQELIRIGGTETRSIDIRLISSSKVNLDDLVKAEMFRSDLQYRINVVKIVIPPLRERSDDIELLANHFIKRYAPNRQLIINTEALNCMENYHWPGNIRELRNVIHRATIFCNDEITIKEIPPEIRDSNPLEQIISDCSICFNKKGMHLNQILGCIEYKLILEALRKTKGNQSHAAQLLHLSLSTFRDRFKKYQSEPGDCDEAM
jgi:transcriptional regulator with PAS, ATPase and Fis domain